MRHQSSVLGAALLAGLATVTGCRGAQDGAVAEVAAAFHDAYAARDGAAACDLLAPETKSELERLAGEPCAGAVLEEDVAEVGPPRAVEVFGTQAEVRYDGETTFLARFQDGWKVMAAGCTPRPGQPYDCVIAGG